MTEFPILERLDKNNVFDVIPNDDGTFLVGERCDEYFWVNLTANELRALGQELIAMANGKTRAT